MNEEELKLLEKLDELPRELNIQIRGLLLNEVFLRKENQQLKEKLEASEKSRKEALSMINSKEYVIDFSTFGYELNNYEIFKLKNILDIDKGE